MPPVRDILGIAGPVAAALGEGYEPREPQLRMADAVAETMAARGHLVVEAGTGVGKSFAYLVPAIDRALHHGQTVLISTHTIALQEQLLEKDIPLLARTIRRSDEDDGSGWAGSLRPVLVKGRGNYLSLRRLKLASERQERLLADAPSRRSLHVIEDWAYGTEDGTLSTLPPLERPGVWDRVQSDSGNCMGRKCPTYGRCFYQSARREMERANLLVTNHALFFSDLAMRARSGGTAGFLPRYDHVVLDEAHTAEEVAADHFGLRLGEGRVAHLLSTLAQERTGKGYLPQLSLQGADFEAVERAIALVREAGGAGRLFFESLLALAGSPRVRNGRVTEPDAVENPLTPAMNALARQLRRLKDAAEKEADAFELNAYAIRAAEIADTAEALVAQSRPGFCYWVEVGGGEGDPARARRRVTLACSPVEVGPLLADALFDGSFSVTLTSATLATRTIAEDEPAEHAEAAFAHFTARVGCEGARTLQLGSPFDYARQVEVHLDRTMPEPASPGFERELVARILEHVEATAGGAFCLFTSFATLDRVAAMLDEPLAALGYPVFVQGRGPGGGSRGELLRRFREAGNGVLLGAASFWQGVDVRGEALRNVIITRLPFEPPDRPLTEARLERIRERGGDPFTEDQIPRAVIRFKQGVGRLVRSATDRGRVVILDPRVLTKGYGRAFLRALPAGAAVVGLSE